MNEKRLRCRVRIWADWHPRQCERAATKRNALVIVSNGTLAEYPVCTQHGKRHLPRLYESDGSWAEPAAAEFIR